MMMMMMSSWNTLVFSIGDVLSFTKYTGKKTGARHLNSYIELLVKYTTEVPCMLLLFPERLISWAIKWFSLLR